MSSRLTGSALSSYIPAAVFCRNMLCVVLVLQTAVLSKAMENSVGARTHVASDLQTKQSMSTASDSNGAPWTTPSRIRSFFDYNGETNFDRLVKLRARPKHGHAATISVLGFSRHFALLAQNAIFSMTNLAKVDNYVMFTWHPSDLKACRHLGLPCADITPVVRPLLQEFDMYTSREMVFGTREYYVLCWIRPFIVLRLLRQGYVVHHSDLDIAYTPKDLWASYLGYINRTDTDIVGTRETTSINGGNYVVLPNRRTVRMFEAWTSKASYFIRSNKHDQEALETLKLGIYETCAGYLCALQSQDRAKQGVVKDVAVMGLIPPSHYTVSALHDGTYDVCGYRNMIKFNLTIDPCGKGSLVVHPVCINGSRDKRQVLRQLGMWYLSDRCHVTKYNMTVCHPKTEKDFNAPVMHCDDALAFDHYA